MSNYSTFFTFALNTMELVMEIYEEYWDHEDYNLDSAPEHIFTPNISETLMVLSAGSELIFMKMEEDKKTSVRDFVNFARKEAKNALPDFKASKFLNFIAIVFGVAVQFYKKEKSNVPLIALQVVTQVLMIFDLNGTFEENGGIRSIRAFCFESDLPKTEY